MSFKEEILELEKKDSKANSVLFNGNINVMLTSVHSMVQHKEIGIKKREPFTKGIALYVREKTNCFSYVKFNETNIDSNSLEVDNFKRNLLDQIKNNKIKLLIDIHGASYDKDFDVELGTLNNLSADFSTINELRESFIENGIINIKINNPFLGGGITQYIYEYTNIDIIQIEINAKYRDYNNYENIEKICQSLINFIAQYYSK